MFLSRVDNILHKSVNEIALVYHCVYGVIYEFEIQWIRYKFLFRTIYIINVRPILRF